MNEEKQSLPNSNLRLGSYSKERWAREMDTSEWIIRKIIHDLDKGDGVRLKEIDKKLQEILQNIVTRQNGAPHFYFKLGASLRLTDWLEAEADTDRMDVVWKTDKPHYKLSNFMRGLLQKKQEEIDQLISETTGYAC